ncbi:MAG: magnesium/cobalt transporter CorA [Candidatus Eremiobacterota bacterium]
MSRSNKRKGARLVKKRSKKAGLSPGSLVYIGEKKAEAIQINIMDYDELSCKEKEIKTVEDCFPFKDKPSITWVNIEGLQDVHTIQKLGDYFQLHPLILEDIVNTDQRPKIEDLHDYLYIVLKMITYDDSLEDIAIEQMSLVLGRNFVISFQEGIKGDIFDPLRDRIRTDKGKIRKMGSDYLAYGLMDAIVDNYFFILEKIGDKIEDLEDELIANPTKETLQVIHKLKRKLIFLRKSVWSLREVINTLVRGDSSLIQDSTGIYFRDIYDHTIQVIDTIETFRDIVSGMLDIYLSSISNKMNEIMKVLTIMSTIFIPLTFLAGIYGMNFEFMPELKWHWGYPGIWFIMIFISIIMLINFRFRKWI